MSKHVLSNGISSSAQQPYTQTTHEWYNAMTSEATEALAKSIIPTAWYTGKLVILSGAITTGTNPGARTITEGWAWYNGEVYKIPAASFTTTGSNIGVFTLTESVSQLKFSDQVLRDVHQDKTMVFAAGLSGSGTFDETSSNVVNRRDMPKFAANQDIDLGLTNSTSNQVVMPVDAEVDVNTNGYYDDSNGRYTPLIAGWYKLDAVFNFQYASGSGALGSPSTVAIGFEKNGGGAFYGTSEATVFNYDERRSIASSTLIYFNGSTDYIRLLYVQNQALVPTSSVSITITLHEAA